MSLSTQARLAATERDALREAMAGQVSAAESATRLARMDCDAKDAEIAALRRDKEHAAQLHAQTVVDMQKTLAAAR